MKGKKTLFLFLALLLPVAVFLFLKIFGRNEFDVPVLHQDSIPSISPDCHFRYSTPYRIPDSVMTRMANGGDSLVVVYFDGSRSTVMKRISVEFDADPVRNVLVQDIAKTAEVPFLKRCVFLMEDEMSVALVDARRRIRGYYNGNDRDDVDRMIVEIKIILKKY